MRRKSNNIQYPCQWYGILNLCASMRRMNTYSTDCHIFDVFFTKFRKRDSYSVNWKQTGVVVFSYINLQLKLTDSAHLQKSTLETTGIWSGIYAKENFRLRRTHVFKFSWIFYTFSWPFQNFFCQIHLYTYFTAYF